MEERGNQQGSLDAALYDQRVFFLEEGSVIIDTPGIIDEDEYTDILETIRQRLTGALQPKLNAIDDLVGKIALEQAHR